MPKRPNVIEICGEMITVYDVKADVDRCLNCKMPQERCYGNSGCRAMTTTRIGGKTGGAAQNED